MSVDEINILNSIVVVFTNKSPTHEDFMVQKLGKSERSNISRLGTFKHWKMVFIPETYAENFSTLPVFQEEECKPYLNDSVVLFSRLKLKKVIFIS